jgi:hypothetical protein
MQPFKLIPYPSGPNPNIRIRGELERIENRLSIFYRIQGDVDNILLPKPSAATRQDDLWKATCFEFFLAIPSQPPYWEFNMSPSGDWNVYVMDAYRQVNMRAERAFTQLPFTFSKTRDTILLEVSIGLNLIVQPESRLQIGITTIIQTNGGNESYWALAHPGIQADFHLRDGFLLQV